MFRWCCFFLYYVVCRICHLKFKNCCCIVWLCVIYFFFIIYYTWISFDATETIDQKIKKQNSHSMSDSVICITVSTRSDVFVVLFGNLYIFILYFLPLSFILFVYLLLNIWYYCWRNSSWVNTKCVGNGGRGEVRKKKIIKKHTNKMQKLKTRNKKCVVKLSAKADKN